MAANAEKNVSAVKDLLSKAVKVIDGLDDLVKSSTRDRSLFMAGVGAEEKMVG